MMLSPFAVLVIVIVAISSYLTGAAIATAPLRTERRRRLVLLAMTAARSETWTTTFELRKWSRGLVDHSWIYPVLAALEEDDLVESRKANPYEMQERGAVRGMIPFRWYRLSERGAEFVDALERQRVLHAQSFNYFL